MEMIAILAQASEVFPEGRTPYHIIRLSFLVLLAVAAVAYFLRRIGRHPRYRPPILPLGEDEEADPDEAESPP